MPTSKAPAVEVMRLYALLGFKIRQVREEKRISQARLAEKVGLTRTSVTNLEKGRQRIPLHVLYQVAKALDVEAGALLPVHADLEAGMLQRLILSRSRFSDLSPTERRWVETLVSGSPATSRPVKGKES
jgi:transcriptional regulator with XRE-family HTH domain